MFFLNLNHGCWKKLFLIVFELRLRSKLLKYLQHKRQRNRLKIVAAQACNAIIAPQVPTSVYILCYCRLIRPLSKVETRRDSLAHIALNCFQCIVYVFECITP